MGRFQNDVLSGRYAVDLYHLIFAQSVGRDPEAERGQLSATQKCKEIRHFSGQSHIMI